MKGIILLESTVGSTREVANALKNVSAIQSVDVVTGPYDVIVVIDAPDMNALGRLVEKEIHPLGGVRRTVTCVSVDG